MAAREAACHPPPPAQWASPSAWLEEACSSGRDAHGHLTSVLPRLLASALDSHMAGAEAAEAAAALRACGGADVRALRRVPSSCLHGSRPPGISIAAYCSRLERYCGCSPVCFLAAYAYVLRLARAAAAGASGGIPIAPLTAHRLFITGTVVSIKASCRGGPVMPERRIAPA